MSIRVFTCLLRTDHFSLLFISDLSINGQRAFNQNKEVKLPNGNWRSKRIYRTEMVKTEQMEIKRKKK